MMSVDSTIVATALPALQDGLQTSINLAGWTMTAYSFGFVLMLPLSGKLAEQYGRRRVFLGSVIAFTAASLCCGLCTNIYWLIAFRAIQAAGGAGFTPSATGIVVAYFGDTRDRAIGLFGSIFPIGSMIGPIFGGLFVSYWNWRGIFFVNVPIGVAIYLAALRFVPRDPPRKSDAPKKIDIAGMTLLGIGLISGMLAASYAGVKGAGAASAALLIVAIVAVFLFFRHIHRSSNPFISPSLINLPGFGAINLVNGLYAGSTVGLMALVPLYAAHRYGISALEAGTILTGEAAISFLLSVLCSFALRRTGYRLPLYGGAVSIAVGILLLGLAPIAGISPFVWLCLASMIVGVGFGAINPASRNAGLQLAPDSSSSLAALRSMCMQIGTIVTISLATAILDGAEHPAVAQVWIYLAAAIVFTVSLPLIARVPEHRGAW
jgi:EmrB/QacA subfamily drug resistance transporter